MIIVSFIVWTNIDAAISAGVGNVYRMLVVQFKRALVSCEGNFRKRV
jgi:hypothetical protein